MLAILEPLIYELKVIDSLYERTNMPKYQLIREIVHEVGFYGLFNLV